MDIGLHLPSAGIGVTSESIRKVALEAEKLAFDTLWFFDHLFTPSDLESQYPYTRDGSYAMGPADPFYDPLGLYGYLAGATSSVKMCAGVLIPAYRHPIVLAKTLATIENLAPGRVVLGVGTGWMKEEFEAVGVGFERRGARLNEYIQALRSIWAAEPSGFDGEFYKWPEGGFLPAPTSPIPIIVGGHSEPALRRAAKLGDGWAGITGKGQGSGLDALGARIETLNAYLEEYGRSNDDFTISYQSVLWFSDDVNPKLPFTGPPEAIAESIKKAAEIGVTMVDLVVFGPPDLVIETSQRFVSEVKPLL